MTKIKNTKKGMAKKTLSISLAVAMLATSNVPVWAAEFTDGSEAVFTSEVVEDAPVVEDVAEDVPEAQAVDSKYTVSVKNLGSGIQWGGSVTPIKVKITNGNTNITSSLTYRYLENGNNSVYDEYSLGAVDTDGYASIVPHFSADDVGKTLQFQFIERNSTGQITWTSESAEYKVEKREIKATVNFADTDASKAIRYTGKQIELSREAITNAVASIDYSNSATADSVAVNSEAYKNANWTVTGSDTVNAAPTYREDLKVDATGKFEDEHYKVTITGKFLIWRKSFDSIDKAVTVRLQDYEYEFTGNDITVPASKITVINNVTEKAVAGAASDLVISTGWPGTKTNKVTVDMTKGSLVNLAKDDADFTAEDSKATPEKEITVVPRDLTNTTNTQISINTITKDELSQDKLSLDTLKNNLVIKDANGTVLLRNGQSNGVFGNSISVKFKDAPTASEMTVESGKSYTVIVSGDGTNVVKEREVTVKVIAYDLNDAVFVGGVLSDAANTEGGLDTVYTGEKITYGLTAANMTEQLGDLKVNNANTNLVKGVSYEASIRFGENTNAGEAEIIIDGKGDYAGTSKVIKFTIAQRTPGGSDNWLVVPEKVLYNVNNRDANDYSVDTSVVAKFTAADVNNVADRTKTKEYTVTVPTDNYTIEDHTFRTVAPNAAGNVVGNMLTTTVTRVATTTGNFGAFQFTKESELVNKAIKEDDVILEKTEYTYTAKEITPDYKVVVDGVTLEKGKDYTEQITHGINVGEATLVITGKGNYDDTSVSKKFNIVAANISDLKVTAKANVTYTGEQHLAIDELNIKLGEEDVAAQVKALFPTSKTANINAGDATVTLKADEKISKNFVGEKEFTFTIAPATLSGGTLAAYDKNGSKETIESKVFDYDGTAHEFYSTTYKYTPSSSMKFTANDYEIIYRDNIIGKADTTDNKQYGHILVVAKGNYATNTEYTCANGEVVKNVVIDKKFQIQQIDLGGEHTEVTVENGVYAEGKDVEPVVTVTYKGKKLVQGVDYKLTYPTTDSTCTVNSVNTHTNSGNAANANRKDVTNGKTLTVHIHGIGGYYGYVAQDKAWGIDKFDLANAEISLSGTDKAPVIKLLNGTVVIPSTEYDTVFSEDGKKATITAKTTSKGYTGSTEVDLSKKFPVGKAMIEDVDVTGNTVAVKLAGEVENLVGDGDVGYDYVISKSSDCLNRVDRVAVNKTLPTTDTTFYYLEPGTYYAYCHAWTRDEDGMKAFGEWSNVVEFKVTAVTPEKPQITSVKISGSTVTVTYTESEGAEGYDIVLGSTLGKDAAGYKRPYDYGTLVKKNVKAGTTTVTFKDVPAGTYYVGLHAWSKEDGKKVFSKWSNVVTRTVK